MLDGSEVVYLDRVETAWPLRMTLQPGSRVPLHCTASGKLLLASLPAARRRRLVATLALERFTERTIVERSALETELDRIRRLGHATDNEEYLAGLVCVAVPVAITRRRTAACIAVHAPVARMPLDVALEHLPALRAAAAAIGGRSTQTTPFARMKRPWCVSARAPCPRRSCRSPSPRSSPPAHWCCRKRAWA